MVCGPLGEIQATLCGGGRDQCGKSAVGHLPLCASYWSLAVAVQLPAPAADLLRCDVL